MKTAPTAHMLTGLRGDKLTAAAADWGWTLLRGPEDSRAKDLIYDAGDEIVRVVNLPGRLMNFRPGAKVYLGPLYVLCEGFDLLLERRTDYEVSCYPPRNLDDDGDEGDHE